MPGHLPTPPRSPYKCVSLGLLSLPVLTNGPLTSPWFPQLGATSASPSMFSLEHDRTGKDYTLSLKTYNPSPADLTGTYLASYLQSVHPNFAVGVEAVYQYPSPDLVECALGYMAKWHSVTKNELTGQPAPDSWIATGQILSNGLWNGTYWRKLGDKVDAGVDLMISPAANPKQRTAVGTAGVKYDFRLATVRGQLDSTGKVSVLLEQKLTPAFGFLVAGELDHYKVSLKAIFVWSLACEVSR